mmetsp:Transcript_15041/g.32099  ORF Transcript_15041/g.32099 Transcript_15041/m.32099 type:complete len:92 (+) Transcript_15041:898-1173(+)
MGKIQFEEASSSAATSEILDRRSNTPGVYSWSVAVASTLGKFLSFPSCKDDLMRQCPRAAELLEYGPERTLFASTCSGHRRTQGILLLVRR